MFDYTDLLGKGFEYGAKGPEAYDCYTLAQEIYRRRGIVLPDYHSTSESSVIHAMYCQGKELFTEMEKPEPFCIVTFRVCPKYVSHMGVVIDDGVKFIHATKVAGVCVERLDSLEWKRKIVGFYRFRG